MDTLERTVCDPGCRMTVDPVKTPHHYELGAVAPLMSIMVGTEKGAQNGVLIKNAEALERFEKVDTLILDKTWEIGPHVRPAD